MIAKNKLSFDFKHRQMFETMLFIDTIRGNDSTGAYGVNRYGNASFVKAAMTAEWFLSDKDVKDFMQKISFDFRAVVGHNRKATRGQITDANAHPFHEGNVIIVHNGTLLNHREINKDVDVDSHAIAHAFAEHGIRKGVGKIEGAFAIIAYDVAAKKLYAVRNNERPLFIGETDKAWAILSEPWMAYGAAYHEGIKFTNIKEVVPGQLIEFDMNQDETLMSVTEVKFYEKPVQRLPAVVHTFPAKSLCNRTPNRSEEKGGTHPQDSVWKYKINDTICFTPNDASDAESVRKIVGLLNGYRVVAYLPTKDYSLEDVVLFTDSKNLVATINSIYWNAIMKEWQIGVTNVSVSIPYVTANGMVVDEVLMEDLPMKCTACDADIQEEEMGDTYLKIRDNGKNKHICPVCTLESLKTNPNWGGIKAYEKVANITIH